MHKYIDAAITRLRYLGARLRARGTDPTPILRYRCTDPSQVFYIVGAGATVNDLTDADCARIEAGTSASINMAGLAPIAFDICSIELLANAHLRESLAAKVRAQARPAIFWFQQRARHDNAQIDALRAEFTVYSYHRASVSVRRRLETYHYVFRTVIRDRVFRRPDLRVSFALTGSVARLVLLACALGYRRICFVGVDLGSTPYFWTEEHQARNAPRWHDKTGTYDPKPTVASFQGGARVVPNLFDFLRSLHTGAGVLLEFSTIDPAGRSRLTAFLRDELYAASARHDQRQK